MSVSDTLSFIGSSIQVEYATTSGTASASAIYDSTVSFYTWTEWNENPVGFVIGNSNTLWLKYTISVPNLSLNPSEITCHIEPTYSIFDTEYIYTAFALSSGGGIDASTYSAPNSHWYIGGSISNFTNNSLNMSGGWQRANLALSNSSVTYIPIVVTSSSAFSAYSIDCNFYGNSSGGTGVYSFYVMCPYVSGRASMDSGTFVTGGSSGGDINVTVNVDMSETNSLLGDILDGVAPISELVGLLSDDVDIPEAGTIASLPYNDDDYDNMIMTADAILDDIPDTVAAAGFWVEITNSFFPQNSWLRVAMPLLMIMALMTWLLWKK